MLLSLTSRRAWRLVGTTAGRRRRRSGTASPEAFSVVALQAARAQSSRTLWALAWQDHVRVKHCCDTANNALPGCLADCRASLQVVAAFSELPSRAGRLGITATLAAFSVFAATATRPSPPARCEEECVSCAEAAKVAQASPYSAATTYDGRRLPGTEFSRSKLLRAVNSWDVNTTLRLQFEVLPDIDYPVTVEGDTILAMACKAGALKVVIALLEVSADPEVTNCRGATCLAQAVSEGQDAVVKRLLEERARVDVGRPDFYGASPLHKAVATGSTDIVELIVGAKVDPDTPTLQGTAEDSRSQLETPLHIAVRCLGKPLMKHTKGKRYAMIELLLSLGADPAATNRAGDTPLHLCVRRGDFAGLWCILSSAKTFVYRAPEGSPEFLAVEAANKAAARDAEAAGKPPPKPKVATVDVPPSAALQVRNEAGLTAMDEAERWGTFYGLTARLCEHAPQPFRIMVTTVWFSDTLAVFYA